jgi:SAM-dependent methyltransferase
MYGDHRYIDAIYSAELKPHGTYPVLLARRLTELYFKSPGRLLDLGCGRGDALHAFAASGYDVAGIDLSPRSPQLAREFDVRIADLETDALPFEQASFDYVFSKSVVEHSFRPVAILERAYTALRPGGKIVVMTPNWLHTGRRAFYGGVGHVTPFTTVSMRRTLELAGFTRVRTSFFYQLPFLWRFPFLRPLVRAVGLLHIPYRPFYERAPWPESLNKLIRFSTEVMLLGYGERPRAETAR